MSGLIDVVLHEHNAYPRSPVGDDAPEEEDVSLELVLFYLFYFIYYYLKDSPTGVLNPSYLALLYWLYCLSVH